MQHALAHEPHEPATGNYFVSTYPPFSCWDAAGAERFRAALAAAPSSTPPALGLYVHLPFCVQRCHYCYYLSHDDNLDRIDPYLRALVREAERYAAAPALAGRRPAFVYFGGGTPSLLSTVRLGMLLAELQRLFPWSETREVSFECAPKSVTGSRCRMLRDAGVTRISLGVQQLDDDVLRRNGRVHLAADAERAFETLSRFDFGTINVDLIAGLVGESDDTFQRSLERVIGWGPQSVTVYQLEIPLNTPLYRAIRAGQVGAELPDWEVKRRRTAWAFSRLEQAGYAVRSGYTAVRDPERHPFVYQDEQYRGADLIGLGVSSFSYLSGVHQQNVAAFDAYLRLVEQGSLPLWRGHALDADERLRREVVLQLKLGGFRAGELRDKFGIDPLQVLGAPLRELAEQGWIEMHADGVRVTRAGLLRIDRLLPALYRAEHRSVRYS